MANKYHINGFEPQHQQKQSRADELSSLLRSAIEQIVPFVHKADEEGARHKSNSEMSTSPLVEYHSPSDLDRILKANGTLDLPSTGLGMQGFESSLQSLLRYSVNTSAPGFMDKLYSAPLPIGIAADFVLSVLNTNLHVYQVSPVLTLIERYVTKQLAHAFGFIGPRAGGINVQGGSASNMTSIVVARNTLFPKTKTFGNGVDGLDLVMFTSAHGHYSIEKAAQACGFGSAAVVQVPVDAETGTMLPNELDRLVLEAKKNGKTPFYVNATAGTTVLGSFDSFVGLSEVARKHSMWMHVDGAWGGTFVFSERLRKEKLKGIELADSIAVNPHKMMGVPLTCSFLLGQDMKHFQEANTLRAGYLFHDADDEVQESRHRDIPNGDANGTNGHLNDEPWQEPDDLADLTLQCGRRGDSLKLFMAWQYYGTEGYSRKIERAYEVAIHMASLISRRKNFLLVSQNPPPCLQVCFYYAPEGRMAFDKAEGQGALPGLEKATEEGKNFLLGKYNSKLTETVTKRLVQRGFMIDYAPALEGQLWRGKFFRAVVNISTPVETVERLITDIEELGEQALRDLKEDRRQTNG